MTFNLLKNLFDLRGFETLRTSGVSDMNWKSMARIFLILAGKIAIGLFLILLLAYAFILFSVYSAMSSIVSDFGSEASWYDSPIIAGILFITVADFVTGYIFAGLVLKKNKIIAIGLIVALVVLSAFGQYNIRNTKIVGQYMCYDHPETGMFISKVIKNRYTHEICDKIPPEMFLSAVAVMNKAAPRKIIFSSPTELEAADLGALGKAKLYVSIHKHSSGNWIFFDGPGPGDRHSKGFMDLLIPATKEHKDHNLKYLTMSKVSALNAELVSQRAGLATIQNLIDTLPQFRPAQSLTSKNSKGGHIDIPENYVVGQIRNMRQDGKRVYINCRYDGIFSGFLDCVGDVLFELDVASLNSRKISIVNTIRATESEIKNLDGTVVGGILEGREATVTGKSEPTSPTAEQFQRLEVMRLKSIEEARIRNLAYANTSNQKPKDLTPVAVTPPTKTEIATAPVTKTEVTVTQSSEPFLYFDFVKTDPPKSSFSFGPGQNGNKVSRDITIRVDQDKCKKGIVYFVSNKEPMGDICDKKIRDLSSGDEYNIINNSSVPITSKNVKS